MYQIELTIEAESPLATGLRKPGGSVSEAERYISGTLLRGAIAAKIIQQGGQPEENDEFYALFLSESPAIFQNAYPVTAKVDDEVRVLPADVWVLPATALSSKTNPGFKSNPKNYGVFDTLCDRFCAEAYKYPYDPNCPRDGGRVEPYSGLYAQWEGNYYKIEESTRLLTRVGINRRRATSEEQVLYSIEVLDEVQGKNKQVTTFRSKIFVEDPKLAQELCDFVNSNSFRLGGSGSRGLGKVKITAINQKKGTNDVESRIDIFNEKLQNRWGEWKELFGEAENLLKGRTYFTLDLQSDAILVENWRRTTVISEEMLKEMTGVKDDSLKLHVAYSSYGYRSGWNAAWGLKKDVELITNKGAVYLFSTKSPDLWKQAWEKLEWQGVGDRTSEGFGQVRICNEFHGICREEAV